MNWRDFLILVSFCVFVVVMCYFWGIEDAMDNKLEASRQDRFRVYCKTPGHNETLCGGKL